MADFKMCGDTEMRAIFVVMQLRPWLSESVPFSCPPMTQLKSRCVMRGVGSTTNVCTTTVQLYLVLQSKCARIYGGLWRQIRIFNQARGGCDLESAFVAGIKSALNTVALFISLLCAFLGRKCGLRQVSISLLWQHLLLCN